MLIDRIFTHDGSERECLFAPVWQKRGKVDATMTAETNKLVMRRFVEFINTASEKLAQELVSPDAIFHVRDAPSRCAARLDTSPSSG